MSSDADANTQRAGSGQETPLPDSSTPAAGAQTTTQTAGTGPQQQQANGGAEQQANGHHEPLAQRSQSGTAAVHDAGRRNAVLDLPIRTIQRSSQQQDGAAAVHGVGRRNALPDLPPMIIQRHAQQQDSLPQNSGQRETPQEENEPTEELRRRYGASMQDIENCYRPLYENRDDQATQGSSRKEEE